MAMPLEGVRVIDWTAYQQGPVASMMLGDLGAEVIKIEAVGMGDPGRGLKSIAGIDLGLPGGRSGFFEINNRNKKSVTIDLSKPEGKDILYRLVEHSDVFLQNFRVGVAERLGLDYETLRARNPKLIYVSGSGFGPLGPDGERPSYDAIACARSGLHAALYSLESEDLRHPQISVADQSGAVMLAYGVLAALFVRERLGIGQKVESSLLSSMLWLQSLYVNTYLLLGRTFPLPGHNEAINPLVNSYRCRDGKWLLLSMPQYDRFWSDFCKAMGRLDLEHDPRFAGSEQAAANHEALIAELDGVFAARTAAEWIEIFRDYPDFVYQTANTAADLPADPQIIANNYIADFPHPTLGPIKMVNVPVRFSETPGGIRLPAPECGQHTEEVLTEICGYSWDDVVAFREAGAI